MLVLVGPSAVGKTVVANALIKNHQMRKMVTYTTRPMRPGEVEGIDYHFLSIEAFKDLNAHDFFFETVYYNNNYYGTARSALADDKVVLIEPQGLDAYIKGASDQIWICFLACPRELRVLRMQNRGDSAEQIAKRLASDQIIFNDEVIAKCHAKIESYGLNIEEEAKAIYEMYQKAYLASKKGDHE